MYNRLSQLSFIIGLFFSIIAIIVFVNAFLSEGGQTIGKYTGAVFLVFGIFMMFIKEEKDS